MQNPPTVARGDGCKRRHAAPRHGAPRDQPGLGGRPSVPTTPALRPRPSRLPLEGAHGPSCGVSRGPTEGTLQATVLGCRRAGEAREPDRSGLAHATATRGGPVFFACPGSSDPNKKVGKVGDQRPSDGGWTPGRRTFGSRPAPPHGAYRWPSGAGRRRLMRVAAPTELRGGRRSRVAWRDERGAVVESKIDKASTLWAPQRCEKSAPWPPRSPVELRASPRYSRIFRMLRRRFPNKRAAPPCGGRLGSAKQHESELVRSTGSRDGGRERSTGSRDARCPPLAQGAPPAADYGVDRALAAHAARPRGGITHRRPRGKRRAIGSTDAPGARPDVHRVAWYVWGARGRVGSAARADGGAVGRTFVILPLFTPNHPPPL